MIATQPPTLRPYFETDGIQIYHGDAFDVLPQLAGADVAHVLADPPYSSGGAFRSDRTQTTSAKYCDLDYRHPDRPDFAMDHLDARSWTTWIASWLRLVHRCVTASAYIGIFSDWRQLPSATDAIQHGGFVWRGIVPWCPNE